MDNQCKASDGKQNDDGIICSGNGDCKCGECQCYDDYVGTFCNCLKRACPRWPPGSENGTVCGGHGECNICSVEGDPECTCNKEKQKNIAHAKKNGNMEELIKTCMCPNQNDSDKECTDNKTKTLCFDRYSLSFPWSEKILRRTSMIPKTCQDQNQKVPENCCFGW